MRAMEEFVHEYRGRWVVATYKDGRYYAPMRPEMRRMTGASTVFGSLGYVIGCAYSYTRRCAAVKRARQVYQP